MWVWCQVNSAVEKQKVGRGREELEGSAPTYPEHCHGNNLLFVVPASFLLPHQDKLGISLPTPSCISATKGPAAPLLTY